VEYPQQEERSTVIYETESQYQHIEVRDIERSGYTERQLVMDGLVHNRYDPSDRDRLLYDYEKIFAGVTQWYYERNDRQPLSAVTLGGGAMLFPDWMTRHLSLERNEVVEIDPEVIEVAYEYFDVPRSDEMQVYTADARGYINAVRDERSYDIVYTDAFSSYSIPSHLTTREFFRTLEQTMEPNGLLVANTIDVYSIGRFLNAVTNTVEEVFANVNVYIDSEAELDRRLTFVLVASNGPVPGDRIRTSEGIVGERLPERRLAELEERHGERVLTDEHAPVDNMMAPVFLNQVE
jgi:spermidine synthase